MCKDKDKARRDENNKRVLKRMENPHDNLKNGLNEDTWFFIKPKIPKDPDAIRRLYGVDIGEKDKK